ncbi:MAG: hypothetical protein ACRDD8_07185 [Bacteroidales bacterium]
MKKYALIYFILYLITVVHNVVPHHHTHTLILKNIYGVTSLVKLAEIHEVHTTDHSFSTHVKQTQKQTANPVTAPVLLDFAKLVFAILLFHNLHFVSIQKRRGAVFDFIRCTLREGFRHKLFSRPPPTSLFNI